MENDRLARRGKERKARMVLFVLFFPLILSPFAWASEIPLTWEASVDAVAGYKVY